MAIVLIVGGLALAGGSVWWWITSPVVIRVPDGVEPFAYWRQWREGRLTNRIGRGYFFVFALAIGMIVGGCGVAIIK
jgi:hypothetical protein